MIAVYFLRRVAQILPSLLGITILVFVLVRVSGDPVTLMLPEDATQEQITQLRTHLGLDKPIFQQYVHYLGQLLQGDFGESFRYSSRPVLPLVLERLPATLQLTAAAIGIAILISFPAGLIAALNRNRWPDTISTLLATLGEAMPNFWLGIMLILFFAVNLEWLPVSGRGSAANLVLPAFALGASSAALLTRLMRTSLLEVLNQDYIRTAHAKGVAPRTVLFKHALRNASISYITVLGIQFVALMAGAVVTEQVFAWPGVGLLAIQAINSRDMAVVQAVVIIVAAIVMLVNLAIDLLYTLVDPRIQYA